LVEPSTLSLQGIVLYWEMGERDRVVSDPDKALYGKAMRDLSLSDDAPFPEVLQHRVAVDVKQELGVDWPRRPGAGRTPEVGLVRGGANGGGESVRDGETAEASGSGTSQTSPGTSRTGQAEELPRLRTMRPEQEQRWRARLAVWADQGNGRDELLDQALDRYQQRAGALAPAALEVPVPSSGALIRIAESIVDQQWNVIDEVIAEILRTDQTSIARRLREIRDERRPRNRDTAAGRPDRHPQ
jgi:hypothetical protein